MLQVNIRNILPQDTGYSEMSYVPVSCLSLSMLNIKGSRVSILYISGKHVFHNTPPLQAPQVKFSIQAMLHLKIPLMMVVLLDNDHQLLFSTVSKRNKFNKEL